MKTQIVIMKILFSGVTSHYLIDQSRISICDKETILGGEAKINLLWILHILQCKLIISYLSTEVNLAIKCRLWYC